MAAPPTPREVELVLEHLRRVLNAWHEHGTLGEVAVVAGGNEWLLEERPRKRGPRVERKVSPAKATVPITHKASC